MLQQESETTLSQFVVQEKAVLYARVSKDDRKNDGRNLDGQLDMGREYAQKTGYNIVAELKEDEKGASGADIDLPKLDKVIEMANANQFDILIVREIDRLSRNLAKQLIIEEELSKAGVRVEYVLAEYEDSPEGRFNKNIRGAVSEYEREKIAERMRRGRRQVVATGKVRACHVPYGYRFNNDRTMLVIYESEAQTVRKIFDWYIHGWTTYKIAKELTKMRIPTYKDSNRKAFMIKKKAYGHWSQSVVQSVLENKTYMGVWEFGKRRRIKVKTAEGEKKKWVNNPPHKIICVDVPSIVEKEVWYAALARMGENKKDNFRNTRNPNYQFLLRRRNTCECGMKMTNSAVKRGRKVYLYYHCPAALNRFEHSHRHCNAPYFRVDKVDATVWNWIEEVVTDEKKLLGGIQDYREHVKQQIGPIRERLIVVEALIGEQQKEWDETTANFEAAKSRRAKEKYAGEVASIERLLDELEAEKRGLLIQLQEKDITEEQELTFKEFARQMREDIEMFRGDFESRRLLIEKLNIQAELKVIDGQRMVRASGKIGSRTLPLADNTICGILLLSLQPTEHNPHGLWSS